MVSSKQKNSGSSDKAKELPKDFFDQVDKTKPSEQLLFDNTDQEYRKFEEELAQDLTTLNSSIAQEEDDMEAREQQLEELEMRERKERIERLKNILKQKKESKEQGDTKEKSDVVSTLTESGTFVDSEIEDDYHPAVQWRNKGFVKK
eukprot:ctg_275.g143